MLKFYVLAQILLYDLQNTKVKHFALLQCDFYNTRNVVM